MSLKMRSKVKTYYSKSFDSVIRDLYYNLPPPPLGIGIVSLFVCRLLFMPLAGLHFCVGLDYVTPSL
jgi:hypothetical protein